MELSPFFVSYPLVWLFVGLIVLVFVAGDFLRRLALLCYIVGALGFTALTIFAFLYGATYLDVGLIALICLLPFLVLLIVPRSRKKEVKEEERA